MFTRFRSFRPRRFSLQSLLLAMLAASIGFGWWRDHQQLSRELYDLRHPAVAWDIHQVLGAPDTSGAGDIPTAWASQTPDGQDEWLILDYRRALRPKAVVIHETFNPGAVCKVAVFAPSGQEIIAWQGTDPTPRTSPRGVTVIPLNVNFPVRRLKLYIASKSVPGWNEIDAVGLRFGIGRTLWASDARASSTYGSSMGTYRGFPYAL